MMSWQITARVLSLGAKFFSTLHKVAECKVVHPLNVNIQFNIEVYIKVPISIFETRYVFLNFKYGPEISLFNLTSNHLPKPPTLGNTKRLRWAVRRGQYY
jgi:hypothetical protein